MEKMRILVTNDDGYEASGLAALCRALAPFGDLTVVAPKSAQSGMSMAVSMGLRPIAVKKLDEVPGLRRWYLDGTPSSCIKFGIDNIFWPEKPDLVVSGINHGTNTATAAIYSGTVGGAMEGAVNGIPSLAVSLDDFRQDADFSVVEKLFPAVLKKLLPLMNKRFGTLYNINFPALPESEIKGIRTATMGYGHWEDEYRPFFEFLDRIGRKPREEDVRYVEAAKANGEDIYVMAGDFVSNELNAEVPDHLLLAQGYVTVTPHNIDNSDAGESRRLSEFFQ